MTDCKNCAAQAEALARVQAVLDQKQVEVIGADALRHEVVSVADVRAALAVPAPQPDEGCPDCPSADPGMGCAACGAATTPADLATPPTTPTTERRRHVLDPGAGICSCGWEPALGEVVWRAFDRHLIDTTPPTTDAEEATDA